MTDDGPRRLVEPQAHEYTANYNYNQYGLRPWFALDAATKDGGGSVESTFSANGDTWSVTLYFQKPPVRPPSGGTTPAGTRVDHDTIREFRLAIEAHDDVQQRKANFHIRPRWQGMKADKDDGTTAEIPVPEELANHRTDAVNVRISGSNIPFNDYDALFRDALEAVGVSGHYFARDHRHHTSNVQDAARYVRVHTDVSGPIHARTGPLVGLAHVLEDDRSGYRKLVQNDDDEKSRNLPGYYHTATLGPNRVQEVFPNHRLPVECKHYYARDAASRSLDEPLAHPKLEVAYQVSQWDSTLRPDELGELVDELDEWLYAILADAGLDLRAGGSTYVADEYFDAENATTTASVVDLDLTEIRHEQESVVYKHLADGMSPVEQEVLHQLVADGGTVAPQEIADENNRHRDTVYAALERMNDLVDHQYGAVSLESTYLSELVADALDQAAAAVERATLASAKAVNAAERGLDDRTSAFVAWCEKYGLNYSDDEERTTFELGQVDGADEVRKILREGLNRWEAMGRDPATFRTGKVRFRKETGASYNYLPDDDRVKQNYADVFRFL